MRWAWLVLAVVVVAEVVGCARRAQNVATTMPAFVAAPIPDAKAAFVQTAGSLRIDSVDGRAVVNPRRSVKVYAGDHDFRFDARAGAQWAVRFRVTEGHSYRAREDAFLWWRSLEIRDEQTRVVARIK